MAGSISKKKKKKKSNSINAIKQDRDVYLS